MISQMIKANAYGPKQFSDLLNNIISLVDKNSILITNTLSEWLDNTNQLLNKVFSTLKFISIAPSILCDLLNLLQDLRSEELTAKIALIKPIIINSRKLNSNRNKLNNQ